MLGYRRLGKQGRAAFFGGVCFLALGLTAASAQTAPAAKLTPIKIGMSSSATWVPIQVAADHGFFKQNGLDVEIQILASAPDTAKALVAGELNFAGLAIERSIQATQLGKQVVSVATIQNLPPAAILIPNNSTIPPGDFKALKGKTVGIVFGGWSEVLVRTMLKRNNVAWDDIKVLSTPNPSTQLSSLQNHQVDALSANEPTQSFAIATKAGKVFFDVEDPAVAKEAWLLPFVATTLQTTGAYAKQHPDIVKAAVKSVIEGLKYVHENQQAVADENAKKNPSMPADVWGLVISRLSNTWSIDGALPPEALQHVQDVLVENHVLEKAASYADVVSIPK